MLPRKHIDWRGREDMGWLDVNVPGGGDDWRGRAPHAEQEHPRGGKVCCWQAFRPLSNPLWNWVLFPKSWSLIEKLTVVISQNSPGLDAGESWQGIKGRTDSDKS